MARGMVNSLGLTFCLWVVSSAQFELKIHRFEYCLPHVACEDPISVSYNRHWWSMQFEDIVDESLGHCLHIVRVG